MHGPRRVLLAEDSATTREMVIRALKGLPVIVDACGSAEEALALLASNDYAMVISDHMMGFLRGSELLEIVRERHPKVRRVVMTTYSDAVDDLRARGTIHALLAKPIDVRDVRETVAAQLAEVS